MSFKALSWAAKQHLTAHEKLVLFMLADRADDHDKCWPSVRKLMEDCSISRRQVQRCMISLEEHKLLRRDAQTRSYGQTSNMYYLNLSRTIEKAVSTPRHMDAPPRHTDAQNQSPLTSQ
jgi:DNA-binding transcriptional MocR family regulator